MLYEELALALSIRRCILVAYLRFQRPHCRQALRVHTVSHDIRLTRDALVAVPENCPDHDVCHPKLMQIGGQSSPERMPTVPTDRLVRNAGVNTAPMIFSRSTGPPRSPSKRYFLGRVFCMYDSKIVSSHGMTGTAPLPRFPFGSPALFRQMLL
jgi:hypothetical protein